MHRSSSVRPTTVFVPFVIGCLIGCADTEQFREGDGGGKDGRWYDYGNQPRRPACPGREGEITGTVFAPNGTDPVAGATVFIPSVVPELFPPEVKCEVCGSLGTAYNFWATVSASDGSFKLSGVCPGTVSLVIQNGRFRRFVRVRVPESGAIALTAQESRLPRRVAEFSPIDSIPKIAVATGDYDKMECVLRKMGIEQFDLFEAAIDLASPPPNRLTPFVALINDAKVMKRYNVIFINCTQDTFENELKKPEVRQNIAAYVKAGGRLYVTDWSYDWIEQIEAMGGYIDFEPGDSDNKPEPLNAAKLGKAGLDVNGVVKDDALARWLGNFPNTIKTVGGKDVVSIGHFLRGWVIMRDMHEDAKVWVEGKVESGNGTPVTINDTRPLTVTFNFDNCGKVLFSSYHTEGRENEWQMGVFGPEPKPTPFPRYCDDKELAPQERILQYLIFDIASCVEPIG